MNDDVVAKIYDQLYYDEQNEYGLKEDVMFDAHSDCSREAAAYHQLQRSPVAPEVTPAFYGTWTLPVDTLIHDGDQVHKHTRQVPLVLMEYVRAETMRNIDPHTLSEQTRSCLLRRVLDAEIVIYTVGVKNNYICPRNIMIIGLRTIPTDDVPDSMTIKMIDLNATTVRHPRYYGAEIAREVDQEFQAWFSKLSSPILRWYGQMVEFAWNE
jgi:hypothetical protein